MSIAAWKVVAAVLFVVAWKETVLFLGRLVESVDVDKADRGGNFLLHAWLLVCDVDCGVDCDDVVQAICS
jgi:hypothetical protein